VSGTAVPPEVLASLVRMGLVDRDERPGGEALTGGVSSEIYRIDAARGPFCVKRALPRLRVRAVWEAPVERNRYERAYLELAAAIVPGAVPAVLGSDDAAGLFAMTYLDPVVHPVWKALLRDGRTDVAVAAAVGDRIGRIHAATADRGDVAEQFPTAALFEALRLEPYLAATAVAHPDLAARLGELHERTGSSRRVLVHGDVSPKNVLVGPAGPVLLDAECATMGDPAFDVAFCANHLLLKCLWNPGARFGLLRCLDAFTAAYLGRVTWEPPGDVDGRAAALLPALLLARVDGKSPVEYLDANAREHVRRVARAMLCGLSPISIEEVAGVWADEMRATR
jgi:aminoglycoside phosphotransferase (APT) family kinase protein